ncbi:MAG: flippase [Flavobacteriales bacterium]|nr:flippase [Flavobacteriales bacterium]
MIRSEGARTVLRSISWLFVERVLRLGVVLVTGIYVARYLGEVLFGQLNYASGFVGLFFALGQAGIDDILVRDLVKQPEKRNELLGTGAFIKLCGALLMVVLATVGSLVKDMSGITVGLIVVIACAELLRPFTVIDHWFMSQRATGRAVRAQIAQVVLGSGVKFALIGAIHFGHMTAAQALPWFAWAYVVENAALAGAYIVAFRNSGADLRKWKVTGPMARHLMSESWPMLIYGMALFVAARIDQVMIKDLLTRKFALEDPETAEARAFAEVGQYSVALKMVEALSFPVTILLKSLAPSVTKAKAQGHALYMDRLLNQYRLMFLLFLVTAVPLYFTAEWIIVFFFGDEYQPAGALLSLFAIRLFFTNIGTGKGSYILNESLFKYSLVTAILGAAVNISVNWLLIPIYESRGAIWATIISFTVHIFLLDLFVPRMRENLGVMMKGIFTFWNFHRAS